MDYPEVLDYLYKKLPCYQRSGPAAYKGNLDNTLALDQLFDHPHHHFKTVHVGGTNGKGSVSHMLAAIFQKSGYKTGLYTSPHLKDFRERIRINGEMIPEQEVIGFVERYLDLNQDVSLEPSFFELTVMMAFDFFAQQKVDIAIIEVGLGGRLDSTNIICPELSVITNISLDHVALLGDTIGRIALEKAGIIKPGIPVVIGETHPQSEMVFTGIARERSAPVCFADQLLKSSFPMVSLTEKQLFTIKDKGGIRFENLELDLAGNYQVKNICTVLTSIEILQNQGWQLPESAIRSGLMEVSSLTGLMGRWQTIGYNPRIICDTAHNEGGIREVVRQLKQLPFKDLHIVFGMVDDKDIGSVLHLLPSEAKYYFTKASVQRALPSHKLAQMAGLFHLKGDSFETVLDALAQAKSVAGKDDLIFVGGSTFVVADLFS